MSEIWLEKENNDKGIQQDKQYEIKDTIVIRTVSRSELEVEKEYLQEELKNTQVRIDVIDADLLKINELEKTSK